MSRIIALAGLTAALLMSTAATTAYPESDIRRQQCQTQACRECVDQCDRNLDQKMADCANDWPVPGENQEMCFYWALSEHNMCLAYECGV